LRLLAYVPPNIKQDRMNEMGGLDDLNEMGGLDDLDELRWNGWTPLMGWPPVTCWQGCADLHRDDWWRRYLDRTCWDGCKDLHREDWWRAYVHQAD
jgi:hypothetical protein